MDRFVVYGAQINNIWVQDAQRREEHSDPRPATAVSHGPSIRLTVSLDLTPAPAPSRSARRAREESDAEASDDAAPRPKRPRSYSLTDLSADELDLVREKLLKRNSQGDFEASVPDVKTFFNYHFPSIGKCLSERSLYRIREQSTLPVSLGPKKKRGPKFKLPLDIRLEMGNLLKSMGEAGAPMNTEIARPVLVGVLKSKNLFGLYSKTKEKGKITFSATWILKLFNEFNLSDRKGTTDAQHLPEVSYD